MISGQEEKAVAVVVVVDMSDRKAVEKEEDDMGAVAEASVTVHVEGVKLKTLLLVLLPAPREEARRRG